MADIAALTDALRRVDGCSAAFLFGSEAAGTSGPQSDVDVAVLLTGVGQQHRLPELLGELSPSVAPRRLDLVLLDDAPPSLAHRVVTTGTLLFEHDAERLAHFRATTLIRYLDLAPLRAELAAGTHDRILEGRFGR